MSPHDAPMMEWPNALVSEVLMELRCMSMDKPPRSRVPSTRDEMMKHFDDAAATWDDNPHRRELTRAIAAGIRTNVPLQPNWHMLEYAARYVGNLAHVTRRLTRNNGMLVTRRGAPR